MKLELTEPSKQKIKENPEFMQKWIAGLRSGKYPQARGAMVDADVPNSACCLMVMEMECNGRDWEDGLDKCLPSTLEGGITWPQELGLADERLLGGFTRVAHWNDNLEFTFDQIATLLETGSLEVEDDPL